MTDATIPDTTAARGFADLPCPKCGETGSVSIDLGELTGDSACRCGNCDAEFGLADVRDLLTRWSAVIRWIDLAPEV